MGKVIIGIGITQLQIIKIDRPLLEIRPRVPRAAIQLQETIAWNPKRPQPIVIRLSTRRIRRGHRNPPGFPPQRPDALRTAIMSRNSIER